MSELVNLAAVAATLQVLLERNGKPIVYHCAATDQRLGVEPDAAVTPDGLLPAFLTTADAVWHEATGRHFGLAVEADPAAVFGYVVRGIRAGSFSTVLLCLMEVLARIEGPECLLVNKLSVVWTDANARSAMTWDVGDQTAVAA